MQELRGLLLSLSIVAAFLIGICLLASLNCTIKVIQPPAAVVTDTLWVVPNKAEGYYRYLCAMTPSRNYIGYHIVDSVTIDVRFLINEVVEDGTKSVTVEYTERHRWDSRWNCWNLEE